MKFEELLQTVGEPRAIDVILLVCAIPEALLVESQLRRYIAFTGIASRIARSLPQSPCPRCTRSASWLCIDRFAGDGPRRYWAWRWEAPPGLGGLSHPATDVPCESDDEMSVAQAVRAAQRGSLV